MVSVESTETNPSASVNTGPELVALLPLGVGYQVTEGVGTPLVVQMKMTMPPSSPVTAVSASGSVMLTGSKETSTAHTRFLLFDDSINTYQLQ